MSARFAFAACVALIALGACKTETTIPHTPATIRVVSGSNQSGDLGATLDSALVVQVVDVAGKSVSGVPLGWSATGGGTLSTASTTTDNDGKSSIKWTLSSQPGTQVVTVTSSQITGASTSFVADNGAMLTGTVAVNTTQSPFSPVSAALIPTRASSLNRAPKLSPSQLYVPGRVIVGFRADVLGVQAVASMAYRSVSVAQAAATTIRGRIESLTAGLPVSRTDVSPALAAARLYVDPSRTDEVIAALQQQPGVAYVERDAYARVDRVGAWRRPLMPSPFLRASGMITTAAAASVATRLPNDPNLLLQYWNYNMIGLPRAWAITTGSAAVSVAVLDMGVRFDDPDLAPNLSNDGYDFVSQLPTSFTADGTLPMCDGTVVNTIDGDGDGPDADATDPDDVGFTGTCFVHSPAGDHGLWTSGIIGELGNNGASGVGINWSVAIRPVRVLGITGEGSSFDIAQGILYAAGLPAAGANGALVTAPSRSPIINMSLGGLGSSTAEANAVAAAVNAGSLIIAAAGNDGVDLPFYPASYPGVMAVAAVGPDGTIASYSNAGAAISVGAPGGEPRLDIDFTVDTGGDWVWGHWWDFTKNRVVFTAAAGTSAAAPHVAGVAALILAQNPGLNAAALRQRIEQFATRPPGSTRGSNLGWGVVNAYNSLTQQNGPPTQSYVRLLDATGKTVKSAAVGASGAFTFARLAAGAYYLQAGEDESGDGIIGVPGRRFAWAGGFGTPTVFNVAASSRQTAAIVLGIPTESEPNDDVAHANLLSVGSYVVGAIVPPDARDVYAVAIPTAGTYSFETSGVVGTCGLGLELDTSISITTNAGALLGSNDNFTLAPNRFCSHVTLSMQPGTYYVTVQPSSSTGTSFTSAHGRYRLEVRSGN
jgi:subtilisin family serine protease